MMATCLVMAGCSLSLGAGPAAAQGSYERGYEDGYNDRFPSSGVPSASTEYGRGFQAGQDDSDDDDDEDRALATRSVLAQGYHYEQGYTRQDGTYVAPHYQTNPNDTRMDNWSTRGNTNPFTGQPGTQNPYAPQYNPPPAYPLNTQSSYGPRDRIRP